MQCKSHRLDGLCHRIANVWQFRRRHKDDIDVHDIGWHETVGSDSLGHVGVPTRRCPLGRHRIDIDEHDVWQDKPIRAWALVHGVHAGNFPCGAQGNFGLAECISLQMQDTGARDGWNMCRSLKGHLGPILPKSRTLTDGRIRQRDMRRWQLKVDSFANAHHR